MRADTGSLVHWEVPLDDLTKSPEAERKVDGLEGCNVGLGVSFVKESLV